MRSTLAKTLILIVLTGVLFAVLTTLPCGPSTALKRLAGGPDAVVLGPHDPPDPFTLREWARTRLVRDLLDGRRSLWETAALCGEINRLAPEAAQVHKARYPLVGFTPRTDAEYLCAQVMNHAYSIHHDHARGMGALA